MVNDQMTQKNRSLRIVAAVFARGGSKGVVGKNLRRLGDKSLLGHAIDAARQVSRITQVIVSSDDDAIMNEGRNCGADVLFRRPAELASDTAPELLSWRHALDFLDQNGDQPKVDILVSVPTVAPFRNAQDIERALDKFLETECDVVTAVAPSPRSPYFNMVTKDSNGRIDIAVKPPQPFVRRQDAPAMFDVVPAVYVARPEFVRQHDHILKGRVCAIEIPVARAVDIDTEMDWEFAQFLYQKNKSQENSAQ